MSERRKSKASPSVKASGSSSRSVAVINRIKVLSMGSGGCGKSCLIKRFCEERFVSKYIATIGVDYGVKPIKLDGMDVRVNFWDLSGHQEFFEIRNEFYKDTQGILLVYDVTQRITFQSLGTWVEEARKYGVRDSAIWAVCANKIDKKPRSVTKREGEIWASNNGFEYFETCPKTGEGVEDVFNFLFSTVVSSITGN